MIDGDKLIENAFKNPISYNAFCNLVKRQPTVDAVPIRRGEWVDVHFRTVPYDRITGAKKCPYCGKKKD